MEIDRRTFIKGGMGAHATIFLPQAEFKPIDASRQKLSDIYGLDGIADVNASGKVQLTVADAIRLQAKQLHIVQPSLEFLALAKAHGIRVTTRVHIPGNNYHDNPQFLKENLTNYDAIDQDPTDQIGNEIDKEPMKNTTTGVEEFVDLGNYMDAHWFPAAEKVWDRRGTILTPPLAQCDKKNKSAYANEMAGYRIIARKLAEKTTRDQREKGIGIATRGYIFYPDQDPFEHIADVQEVFQSELGHRSRLYVAEGGVNENVMQFTPKEIARLTVSMLSMQIPKEIPQLLAWDIWLHGGSGLRNLDDNFKRKNKDWLDRDDRVAWRKNEQEVNPVFLYVEDYMNHEYPIKRPLSPFYANTISRRAFYFGKWRATS